MFVVQGAEMLHFLNPWRDLVLPWLKKFPLATWVISKFHAWLLDRQTWSIEHQEQQWMAVIFLFPADLIDSQQNTAADSNKMTLHSNESKWVCGILHVPSSILIFFKQTSYPHLYACTVIYYYHPSTAQPPQTIQPNPRFFPTKNPPPNHAGCTLQRRRQGGCG